MSYEQKPGSGSLFPPRQKTDRGPDFRGFLQLPSGEIVGIACWRKQTPKGEFLSLSFDARETEFHAKRLGAKPLPQSEQEQRAAVRHFGGYDPATDSDEDDEIPF